MRNTQTPRTDAAETNWWSEDGLRSAFIVRAEFARELEREMEQLRKERDEARREVCVWQGLDTGNTPRDTATVRGWDCYTRYDK
jgi:hypothetical protein